MFSDLKSMDLERQVVTRLPTRLHRYFLAGDRAAGRLLERHAVNALRISLAIVFLWFGALKVLDLSPVEDLVKATLFFLPGDPVFFLLGCVEIAIGIGLLVPIAPRATLVLFLMQMSGTFLTFVILPELTFQGGNPLLLTVLGEFVLKNIVLIAAGLVIGAHLRRHASSHHVSASNPPSPNQKERDRND